MCMNTYKICGVDFKVESRRVEQWEDWAWVDGINIGESFNTGEVEGIMSTLADHPKLMKYLISRINKRTDESVS